LKTLSHHFK